MAAKVHECKNRNRKRQSGDSLDQQCQPMPEAFKSLSPDFANFNYYDS